jgi:D-glycero-D-manno-heptose 1,7-bisphosphate phosphatase
MAMSKRAVFLDQDGTLIDDVAFNADPRRITLSSGAGAALRMLARLDYRVFIVSNQDGVARGDFPEAALEPVRHRLADLLFREQLSLDGFYYCPHHPQGKIAAYAFDCLCRKPMPGMLLLAAREHDINLHDSWMVGGILHDVEAGNRAGCRTVLIDGGNETEWKLGLYRLPTRVVTDIYAAALVIAAAEGEER